MRPRNASEAWSRLVERLGVRVAVPPLDLNAVRASVRRAVVENEVERRQGGGRLLRVADVKKMTGRGRTTLWQLERDGLFPKRVQLVGRAVAWREAEVRQVDRVPHIGAQDVVREPARRG